MKKIILSSLLMTQLFTVNVFADNELKISNVFVTATRTPIAKNNVIADVTTISSEDIERAGSSSLPELLQRQPGIEISNLGGPGKVSTLSLRGTSSTHSIVLIDGMRVGAATSGFSAIEHIPLSQIRKIEILRGPASSLYGQDAIGGVIQIFTKKGVDGFKPYVGIGIADFSNSPQYAQRAKEYGITVIPRSELRNRTAESIVEQAISIAGALGGPMHVDFDVDVCDRSVVPGCPAAAPGGISADEFRNFAHLIGASNQVRSVDFTEVDAQADAPDGRTVRLVAVSVLELLCGLRLSRE